MKNMLYLMLSIMLTSASCTEQNYDDQSPIEVFEEFWTWVDENYIYFEQKEVDWDEVKRSYAQLINENTTDDDLFSVLESALLELNDTHNRLQSKDRKAKTHNFRDGYEIHFNDKLVKDKYIKDSLGTDGYLYWGLLDDNIGYVSLSKFNRYRKFRSVFEDMANRNVDKLIIDIRGNGGGDSNDVPELLNILVKEKTALGAYIEKSGPGHNDITDPIKVYAEPDPNFVFNKPIVVLIDRDCYSATSYFAAMIKGLDDVTVIGQVTGGGGGGNIGYQLSNGWIVAVSISDFVDKEGVSIENGVKPDVEVENTAEDLDNGMDKMLEKAMGW